MTGPEISMAHLRIRTAEPEPSWLRLSAVEKAELAHLAKRIEFKSAKTQIFEQGEKAGFLYLLVDGIAQVSRMLPDGSRHIVAFHWPCDLFGLEEKGRYVNTAESVTPCTVYQFQIRRLEEFLLANPQVQQNVLVQAVHKLRAAQRQVIMVGRLSTRRALAAFLLDCATHEQYFKTASKTLDLPMTRYDIADYLGTAAESVTRAFSKLEADGLIQRVTPRELVLDLSGLRRLANLD
ncbi:Crp/Fnr family transcriptional regulator [Acidocella sp.]|uniref:Crp/Fnr family transcriptional regulator n=1 Tax=Acidocella sp. TaxID=50710 RepID=UPI003CFD6F39